MKNFIALDTSCEYLTVIARKDEKTRIIFEENCAMQHSVRLMDAIEEAAGAVGLAPAECDFFCAAVGPGSFTGIRIGISAVKGLCAATGKPALPHPCRKGSPHPNRSTTIFRIYRFEEC